jgi:hypothetical protein
MSTLPLRCLYSPREDQPPVDPARCLAAVLPPTTAKPAYQCKRPARIGHFCTYHATQRAPRKLDVVMPAK